MSPFLVCAIVVLAIWAGFAILWLGLKLIVPGDQS